MGTYLSTPVTDKSREEGEWLANTDREYSAGLAADDQMHTNADHNTDSDCSLLPSVRWGVVDMQGWRKTMEDAHVAVANVSLAPSVPDTSEVEPPIAADQNASFEPAVSSSSLSPLTGHTGHVFGVFDGHGGPEVARFCQLYLVSVLQNQQRFDVDATPAEQASPDTTSPSTFSAAPAPLAAVVDTYDIAAVSIVETSHAGAEDGMDVTPPATLLQHKHAMGDALIRSFHALDRMIDDPSRKYELIGLRSSKPGPGELANVEYIPNESSPPTSPDSNATDLLVVTDKMPGRSPTVQAILNEQSVAPLHSLADNIPEPPLENGEARKDTVATELSTTSATHQLEFEDADDDEDSNEATGHNEAARLDRNLHQSESDDADDEADDDHVYNTNARNKVSSMFQRLLSMSTGGAMMTGGMDDSQAAPRPPLSASRPTLVHNGRLVCNLPDHPIHAGATAIVAVLLPHRQLIVANAGDSRAVLGRRDGVALALSVDHKPLDLVEKNRIQAAGGFVNQFGRVNGNLNLSRSIGDLKYKQVPGLEPKDQMISAQPDIVSLQLDADDEFLVLGCDGIWDCLSNQQAVEFVRARIDTMPPAAIGVAMLDEIISDDPRVSQGVGGDNMTVLIVDLLPETRDYRNADASSSPAKVSEANDENTKDIAPSTTDTSSTASESSTDSSKL